MIVIYHIIYRNQSIILGNAEYEEALYKELVSTYMLNIR